MFRTLTVIATSLKQTASPRAARKLAILAELGWNSLSGAGLNLSYSPVAHLSVEAGGGLSFNGLKGGARVRGNLFDGEWSPTAGVGLLYTTGSGGQEYEVKIQNDAATVKLYPTTLIQAIAGMSFVGDSGFTFLATVGYAHALRRNNLELVSGSERVKNQLQPFYVGGVTLSVAAGYAF